MAKLVERSAINPTDLGSSPGLGNIIFLNILFSFLKNFYFLHLCCHHTYLKNTFSANLSTVALSSRLDQYQSSHGEEHSQAVKLISEVRDKHSHTSTRLENTNTRLEGLGDSLTDSVGQVSDFLTELGRVAGEAARQLQQLQG